jgi:lipoate-protein ligase A
VRQPKVPVAIDIAMKLLDLTLETPAENLALDEALLDAAEAGGVTVATDCVESAASGDGEVLRLWESPTTMVVLGNSSRLEDEVNVELCRQRNIPILRRASGGAAIVAGPGCLMYAVVLSYQKRPQLRSIDATHRFVMETIAATLLQLVPGVTRAGTSDLVLGDKKFSGNSLRCKRNLVLYHGTLLYDFLLEQIGELLKMPLRQPEYRHQRSHHDFVTNLPLTAEQLRQAMAAAFAAGKAETDWPREFTSQLVAKKYSQAAWNERL